MRRTSRFTPVAIGLAAVLILGGSIAAAAVLPGALSGHPFTAQSSPTADETPSAEKVDGILARLKAVGISTTAEEFDALAAKYGVGGAVRILAFAHAAGKSTADIAAMRDAGKGWGQIRHELGISIGPGIGWIMGQGDGKSDKKDKADKNDKTDKADTTGGDDSDDASDEGDAAD